MNPLTQTPSYELGTLLGIAAKPLQGCGDWSKNVVGRELSRKLAHIEDARRFAREFSEKAALEERTNWVAMANLWPVLNAFEGRYDAEQVKSGFFSTYLANPVLDHKLN